ncbi:MAG: AraC family transcriptional regulator [Deltaproteobacteria bacterium]|nr:AraC family transcriptional regulator [Deltaproteobacteria bacterium]
MGTTVLSVATRAVLEACERLGLDGAALLASARIDRADLADPDARIPSEQADQLWAAAFARADDPMLSLNAALALPVGAYRVLHYIGAHAPTLGAGLERVTRYFPLVDARVTWRIDHAGGDVALSMAIPGLASGVPRPPAEYTFAAILHQTRASTGIPWWPRRVDFEHAATSAIAARHRQAFGCPCEHGADRTAMVLDVATWERPVPHADPGLFALLDRHAGALVAEVPREAGLVARVRALLGARMQAGEPVDMATAARLLGLGERTLQRRLDEEGTRFAALVDEVRAQTAKTLLADRTIALSEIAFLLGFSEQSAFTRAFKRWTGETPALARAQRA